MHRLWVEVRRRQSLAFGTLPAEREHVGRDIGGVDVETRVQVRDQQPAGTATRIQRRLARLDERPEELELGPVEVVLGPPAGNEPVVPRLRLAGQAPAGG